MKRNWRRLLVRIGIPLLVVFLFLVIPGYVSTTPWFLSHFSSVSGEYKAWSTSTHSESPCEACHVAPGIVTQVLHRVRMLGVVYISPVSRRGLPKSFGTPTNTACIECHTDLRTVSPKGDLQIPHRAHVTVLKMNCVDCHDFLVHETSPEGKHTPPMSGCLTCHDGDVADNACSACHTEKALPQSHRAANWSVAHAQSAKDPECAECHAWVENWCVDCHERRPRSHGDDWRATHRDRVKTHRSCEACHEAAFCVRCHGEVPQLNYNPAIKLVE